MAPKLATGLIVVVDIVAFVLLGWASSRVHGGFNAEFWLTVVVGILGVVCGWLVGFLASPSTKDEGERFSKYAGIISSFVSGYLLSKFDPILTEAIHDGDFLTNPIAGMRLMVLITCLVAGVLIMYIYRSYLGLIAAQSKKT